MSATDLEILRDRLRDFAAARDWEQFHDPKNLSMALAVEAAELLEVFQWLTPVQSRSVMESVEDAGAVSDELADVLIYLVRIADVLGVDLASAAESKIARNEVRFPAL